MKDIHNIVIVAFVSIIVIFLIAILGVTFYLSEGFDSVVPQNLGFLTKKSKLYSGTPITNVTQVLSGRHPIAIENTTNWFNTQPMIPCEHDKDY